jgi:hypothetical protein
MGRYKTCPYGRRVDHQEDAMQTGAQPKIPGQNKDPAGFRDLQGLYLRFDIMAVLMVSLANGHSLYSYVDIAASHAP